METFITLKKCIDLSEDDLVTHSVWLSYYEPDEFELLDQLGINTEEIISALKIVEYSDEYVFPIPESGATLPFKYIYLSATVTTSSDRLLYGYRTSSSLSILYQGQW